MSEPRYTAYKDAKINLIEQAPNLLEFAEWALLQLQGESGAGDNYWCDFPEYHKGIATINKAKGENQ